MQKIQDRTYDYTGPDGVYSLGVERAMIWDSLTSQEGQRLQRYEYLCKKEHNGAWEDGKFVKHLVGEELDEWLESMEWVSDQELDLSIIPRQLSCWR